MASVSKKLRKLRQDPGLFLHDLVAGQRATPSWLARRLEGFSVKLFVRWGVDQTTVAPLLPRITDRIKKFGAAGTARAANAAIEQLADESPDSAELLCVATTCALADHDLEVASSFAREHLEATSSDQLAGAIVQAATRSKNFALAEAFVDRLSDDSRIRLDFILARMGAQEDAAITDVLGQGIDAVKAYAADLLERAEMRLPALILLVSRLYAHYAETREYPELVTELGEQLLELEATETNVIRIADTFLHRGHIGEANRIIDAYFDDDSARMAKKRTHLRSFAHLLENGFDYTVEPSESSYRAFPGRVLATLHNSLPIDSGGYAARTHGLLTGIDKHGWYISGVTRLGYPLDRAKHANKKVLPESRVDGIRYMRMMGSGLGKQPLFDYLAAYADALYQLALLEEPEIIHSHANAMNGVVGNKVARALGIKSVYEVRGLWEVTRISRQPSFEGTEYFQLLQNLEVQAAREADAVVCITEALKDEMVRRGVDADKISIVPNAVNIDRFVPRARNEELAEKLGLGGKRVIGYIGSIVDYEGLDDLMRAIARLLEKGTKDLGVLIVGDGAVLDSLKELTCELGLDEVVTFTGRVPHEEIPDYYSIVDVAPFPRKSLPVTEMVSPLKPFEAMAMEKVLVASNVAALQEIVVDGVNGFLFEKDNIDSLTATLEKALAAVGDSQLTPRAWATEHRSWKKVAAKAASLYTDLVGREQPNRSRPLKDVSMRPEVVSTFDAYRERFGEEHRHHLRRDDFARFSVVLDLVAHETSLLDVGVETGQFLNACAARGTFDKLRGVDVEPHSLLTIFEEGSFEMDYTSIEQLPYEDGEFDVVTCLEVIEHLPEAIFEAGIAELRRVCGRQLIVTVPFRERVLAEDHKRRFYLEDLERLFPSANISFLRKANKIEGRESVWAVVEEIL